MLLLICFIFQSKDEEYIDRLIFDEEQEAKHRRQVILEEEQREKNQKKKNKEALIDELVCTVIHFKKTRYTWPIFCHFSQGR